MQQTSERGSRSTIGKVLGTAAAAALCLAVLSQANLAHAAPHGDGGFHGGGGGGFHGGGFHGGAFHQGGFHPGFGGFHGGGFHDGRFHGGRFFGGIGGARFGAFYPYDYGDYGYADPSYSQTWYYCTNPAGYYPYVTQCYSGWQAVSG